MLNDDALRKKQQFAVERAQRLRDPRLRCLGIDKAALDEQVKEKKAMQELEKQRDTFYAQQSLAMDQHAVALQQEADRLRIERERDVVRFRDTFQKKSMGREFDLQDPNHLKHDVPARVNDADPRCGPASMQAFDGEDLAHKGRVSAQREQQRRWALQQADEKLMKKWVEKDITRAYEDRSEEMSNRTFMIDRSIADQRRQMAASTAEFNRALAEQKRKEREADKIRSTQKNLVEVENMLNSDLLCEQPAATHGADFKGMTATQRQAILQTQEQQRDARRRAQLEAAEAAKESDTQEALQARMAILLDRQRERERRETAKHVASERQQQATEAGHRKKELDALYANQVTDEYFVFGQGM